MTDTTLHELCKGFGALLSRSKVCFYYCNKVDVNFFLMFLHTSYAHILYTNIIITSQQNNNIDTAISRGSSPSK